MTFDGTNKELADRLEFEKSEVKEIGFALGLITGRAYDVDAIVHRINCWIDDACERLRRD